MARLDFICRDCQYRVDNQSKIKCRREVKQVLVCNAQNMWKTVSARSSGALSKDGIHCEYYKKKENNMNKEEFVKAYQEIENLIGTNWSMICDTYKFGKCYGFEYFSLVDEDIYIRVDNCYEYADHKDAYIPLEWFESEDVLQSKLKEVIKKNEEEELRKAKEEEERKAIAEEKKMAEMQKILDEYYKTHPRKPNGGNYN